MKMRKQIMLLDKSSLQRLNKQEREPLDYRYDIRYSPILSYELLIGSEKIRSGKNRSIYSVKNQIIRTHIY